MTTDEIILILIESIKNVISNLMGMPAFKYLIMFVVIAFIIKIFKPKIKGAIGEKTISFLLKKQLKNAQVLNDVLISTKSGSSQIDHIVIANNGVFVIETKNYKGWIYGRERDKNWTQNI